MGLLGILPICLIMLDPYVSIPCTFNFPHPLFRQRKNLTPPPQVGQIPILDLLLLKNPLYLLLAKYKLIDATFPVARFAQQFVKF